ncbi:membrane protein insertase YidC [Lachnospiraceae bacterium C1.1]|nr:membrane protein insertase YidC [Lachnospiraceae bacterium C1.1]
MLTILYNIIIMPLVLIMELIFSIGYRAFSNPGLAIIGVSLGVNLLSFPLYRRADAIQDEEREIQKKMAPYIKHIRKSFKGDERFMILQAYYRQQNYSPLMVFRGSLPLLLQIPFFTAAYRYLSNLSLLNGTSFFIFKNLGTPDQLIHIGGLTLNLLPILMTLINFISGYIYTRGFRLKDKAQLYILALFFLVFLYHCPSGLVFYWTLNNLFSLAKNIFMKLVPNPKKVLAYLISYASLVIFIVAAEKGLLYSVTRNALMIIAFIICNIPRFRIEHPGFIKRGGILKKKFAEYIPQNASVKMTVTFGVFLTFFMGAIIPLAVIGASPLEFVDKDDYINPLRYILTDLSICAGYFLVWGGIILYGFSDKKGRRVYNLVLYLISIAAVVNYMCFNRNFGSITIDLIFDRIPSFTLAEMAVNILVLLIIMIVAAWLLHRFPKVIEKVSLALLLGSLIFTGVNLMKVNSELAASDDVKEAKAASENAEPFITLSKSGKNVIVLMLDRAISGYVPYMFNENSELKEQFAGFTYYPNTISFGEHTNYGAPAIFGGYEYTPTEMNARDDELLKDKSDEALKVMPVLFSENGYNVTVADPPNAGYKTTPDLSIYDGLSGIKAVNTENGEYFSLLSDEEKKSYNSQQRYRNFFFYSLYRVMPRLLQPSVYDKGYYLSVEEANITKKFLERYAVLSNLEKLTTITDDDQNQFLMMQNSMPHNPVELQLPDYTPKQHVNNGDYTDISNYTIDGVTADVLNDPTPYHYHVNMSSFMRLGEWFDYLREEGVYDNTRIIIVADHGYGLGQFDYMIMDDGLDVQALNPLLMYKDFADSESETDDSFMTNADVPTMAMSGLIDDMTNPFTGKLISSDEKNAHDQIVTTADNHSVRENNGETFDTGDWAWYSVHDDIFDSSNWTNLGADNKAAEE